MRPEPKRRADSGVVLINVLVVLALASAVLVGMIRLSDLAIARAIGFADAARAQALVAGGEASAIAALTRDWRDAPATDHLAEPWAAVAQSRTEVDGGTFSLTIADAQGRFDLNALRNGGAVARQILTRIVDRLDLPADTAPRIAARLARPEPLLRLDDLIPDAGLSSDQLLRLRDLVTLLPVAADVNINTAPDDLLFALADNPVQARGLVALRRLKGELTPADMQAVQMVLLPGVGYASRLFEVTVAVEIGRARLTTRSLLMRRIGARGPEVVVVGRSVAP